ncbi:C40 family peptidase [Paenibacillus flagellatus]|uniref:Peptidase P60 n=1 Tax=Paenibacillus flagellatus TaxID=2211139 RepID=A0A2V5KD18_9BACL|nr:C40 family peptidase [Paenibacillus flagellatus]PYI55883.1 peptidase P60 [Paenibacillus flagellatus]
MRMRNAATGLLFMLAAAGLFGCGGAWEQVRDGADEAVAVEDVAGPDLTASPEKPEPAQPLSEWGALTMTDRESPSGYDGCVRTEAAVEDGDLEREYVVQAAVATLWSEPGRNRLKDEPALAAAVDMKRWTASMTLQEKLWLVGKLETQALYGQRVKLLGTSGEWANVIVPGQSTSRHKEGYPGWMPMRQLAPRQDGCAIEASSRPVAVVKTKSAVLYDDPAGMAPFLEVSFNTRLPVRRESDGAYVVATPSGEEKYLLRSDATIVAPDRPLEPPTGERLVETAKQFLGLPYLWAGVSGFGFDCSGFTHSLYGFHGIDIPRDASDQANEGTAVERGSLQPGDLVFFARDNGKGKVHHVGMYAGGGRMIHSPKSERSIEFVSLDAPDYAKEYAGARRYLRPDATPSGY